MTEAPTKFTRRHKLLLASLATISLSLGAAGIVSAQSTTSPPSSGPTAEAPEAPGAETPDANEPPEAADNEADEANETEAADTAEEVDGVDCENGIVKGTGAECDGGPSANPQDGPDDASEAGAPSSSNA
jgi:hypothetical protein